MTSLDPRPTLDAPDDDPYRWLEEIDGAAALDWVERQNAATLARFGDARFEADRETLRGIYDRPDNIPYVGRRGARLFNFWKDATNPRGLWRTTTLDSFRTAEPAWDVLLDLDALAAREGEDWIWSGAATLPVRHDRAVLRLSRGGGDAVVLREFDLATRDFVPGGFDAPEAKADFDWLDRDTLLLSSALGPGMATRAGYARTVRLWRRGTDPLTAPVIFETREDFVSAGGSVDDHVVDEKRLVFVERPGFFDAVVWLGDASGPKQRLDLPTDAWPRWHRGWLAIKLRTPWTVAGESYAPDTVLGIEFERFLAGDRSFVRLFEAGERRALQGFFWSGDALVLSILDDLRPVFEVCTPDPGGWARHTIPGVPEIGVAHASSLQDE
jgi:prolyl oligopeptidase